MDYAVFQTGGKQYKVCKDTYIEVEKLEGEVGAKIEFNTVLLLNIANQLQLGKPYVENATIEAEVLEQKRAPKIQVLKFRRRKHHMKQMGHRQYLTKIKINAINSN